MELSLCQSILSDGSRAYDVNMRSDPPGSDVICLPATTYADARALIEAISAAVIKYTNADIVVYT